MSKIIITGGTGLVGMRLAEMLLERGDEVIIMSRTCNMKENPKYLQLLVEYPDNLSCAIWNPDDLNMDAMSVKDADAIVNLAGAGVADEKWSDARKKKIISSRVNANETIINHLAHHNNNIKTIVNASAIGWYGDDNKRSDKIPFSENTSPASDFLAQTCLIWENTIDPIVELGKRLVKIRTGIVLSNDGGAYPQLKKSLNMRVASVLGNGRQIVSWIHIDDLCLLYIYALENEEMSGVYNAVAPFSITNEKLVKTIAERIHKNKYAKLKVPKTILKMALGEMSNEVLKSCLVSSKKILESGFTFEYPRIKDAVEALEKK